MTDFVQTEYPKYEFNGEERNSKYPKGCYVYLWVIKPTGYFNNHWSGSGDLEARAICIIAEGMKQAIIYLSNISLNLFKYNKHNNDDNLNPNLNSIHAKVTLVR